MRFHITYKLSNSVWCVALGTYGNSRGTGIENLCVAILSFQLSAAKVSCNVAVAAM